MALRAAAVLLLLLLPAVQAHTPVYSADGRVRGSVGLLAEPVSTYAVTGLDVCFTENSTATPRAPITGFNAGNFTATLRSPGNETFTADLEIPFGRPNCLTFADPLVLTEPGQYLVDLQGSINGTTVQATGVKAGGEVLDRASITFPDASVPSNAELRDELASLRAEVQALKASRSGTANDADRPAPAPAFLGLLLAVALAVAFAGRRQA